MELAPVTLHRLLSRLPFPIDATDDVNQLYLEYCREQTPDILEMVDLWTYCYVRRYYQMKYARDFDGCIADYEKMIADCFRKITAGRKKLGPSKRYASWVSVICKNTFLNYIRSNRRYISVERSHVRLYSSEPDIADEVDSRLLFHALQQAIDRLPAFLRGVATRRIVDEKDYATIAEETGKPVPTIRSYVNKAVVRLRKDRRFMRYFENRQPRL